MAEYWLKISCTGMVGADIYSVTLVFALGIGVHMVKLAVALTHDSFPNKKLGSDISCDLAGVLRVPHSSMRCWHYPASHKS